MMYSCSERRRMIIWSLCLIFFSLSNSILVFASPAKHLCRPDQRDALWEFKSEFNIEENLYGRKIDSWRNNINCCSWDGVSCDPKTGNVVELDLRGSPLNGHLRSNSSLFRLQHLQSLDLTWSKLSGILPDSIGNFKYLKKLSLRFCNLFGMIPSSLGNISSLTNLDLFSNDFTGEIPASMGDLNHLASLELGFNKLSGNFPHVLLNLSELTYISLGYNEFKGMLPSNMSRLSKLDFFLMKGNSFSGTIPSSLFMIPSLIHLDLSINNFTRLPLDFGNISSTSRLEELFLGKNDFSGPILGSISKLVGLRSLGLSFWNTKRGIVDFSIFLHLKSLEKLDLSYINTRSMVDLSLFSHFMSLYYLDLSGNNLNISSTLHLPSPISLLFLSSCNISKFPEFLQTQTRLESLDISFNQIEGQVPEWLWSLPDLGRLYFSQNSLSGFEGPVDVIQRSAKLYLLDISSNAFQDPFPLLPNSMGVFLGSDNWFSGEIPRKICKLVVLDILVLSNNNFNGSIPHCTALSILDLHNNSLSGIIPEESISDKLETLDVGHNQLSGALPKSLINCTLLQYLNLEHNMFNDTFLFWLTSLPNLQILVLRSNEFHGPISSPGDSLSFPKLRIFDISKNHFAGVFPSDYFAGWSAMSSVIDVIYGLTYGSVHSLNMTNKGSNMELAGISFNLYKTIDVSGNKFEGDIPESIGLLRELIVLNMSNNAFTGHIPPSLTNLTNLESLDLSQNGLSGEIPRELGKLTFLAQMNFSHNRLEGPIPQGTQIQSQDSYSFAENLGLCGAPLQETCGRKEDAAKQEEGEEEEENDEVFSWIAAAVGYVPGVFCGLTIGHILISYKHEWFMRIFHCFT